MAETEIRRQPAPTAGRQQAPGWIWWPYRVAATLSATLLCLQPVLAGQFLAGSYSSLHTHRENATYAGIAVLLAAVTAIPLRWPGRGPWWPIAAHVGLFALIALQIVLGFLRLLAVHIPLGVTIVGLGVWLAVRAWRLPSPAERLR